MKNLLFLTSLFSVFLVGCVTKVDIPDEENTKLFITCEMVGGERIAAFLSTSNNLNGSHPILFPSEAEININEKGVDYQIPLLWDGESKSYLSPEHINTANFILGGRTYVMSAKVNNSSIPPVESQTGVGATKTISSIDLIASENYVTEEDQYWQGTVKVMVEEPVDSYKEQYMYIEFMDQKSLATDNGDGTIDYTLEGPVEDLEIVRVNDGVPAITTLEHKPGIFIHYNELVDNSFELVLRSSIPITEPNQVTDFISTELTSVSKEHYLYHISVSNIIGAEDAIFSEPSLLSSNINQGLGLFSGCVKKNQSIELRK